MGAAPGPNKPRFMMGEAPAVISAGLPVSSPMMHAMARPSSLPLDIGQEGGQAGDGTGVSNGKLSPPQADAGDVVGVGHLRQPRPIDGVDLMGPLPVDTATPVDTQPRALSGPAALQSPEMGGAVAAASSGSSSLPGWVPPPPSASSGTASVRDMLTNRRMVVVSFHLPVILRRGEDGTWVATWDVDNFLARSKHSVASELPVQWVGCVTRRCVDAVTASEGTRAHRSSDVSRISADDIPPVDASPLPSTGSAGDALDAAGASAATLAALAAQQEERQSTVIHTEAMSGDAVMGGVGAGATAPRYVFAAPHAAGASASAPGDVLIPAEGLGSSPPFPLDGASPPLHPIREPSSDTPPAPPVSDEDFLDLTSADQESIRAALRPMNVTPIFLGHDNVVLAPPSPRKGTRPGDVDHRVWGSEAETMSPTTASDAPGDWYAGQGDDPGYRQLVPRHALEGEAAAERVEVSSGLDKATVRAFGMYCSTVLRSAMNNVLDLGPNIATSAGSADEGQGDASITSRMYKLRNMGWRAYVKVNEYVARVAAAALGKGDIVWTHDYHMCMVPHFLAQLVSPPPPQVFYMHASWPTSEVFRSLAEREHLLNGMLQADVIGFHTFNHARHFLQCCKRILGLNYASRGGSLGLDCRGRDVMVDISHMGVDVPVLDGWMASEEAAAFARHLRSKYPSRLILGGFDVAQRLSGVALKLLAYERLLEENPRYRTKLVLVQRCELRDAPAVDAARTSREIRTLVKRIKARWGPVVDYAEAVAFPPTLRIGLFHCADVLVHTPVREGLNLIPLQYVYVRTRWELQRSYTSQAAAGGQELGEGSTSNQAGVQGLPADAVRAGSQDDGSGSRSGQGTAAASSAHLASHYATLGRGGDGGLAASARAAAASGGGQIGGGSSNTPANKGLLNMMGALFASFGRGRRPPAVPQSTIPEEGEGGDQGTEGGGGGVAFHPARGLGGIHLSGGYAATPHRGLGEPPPPEVEKGLREDAASIGGGSVASTSPALSGLGGGDMRRVGSLSELHVPTGSAPLVAPLPPPPRGGCVVLSEASTASHILNSHIVVNPFSLGDLASSIDKALWMPDRERALRQMRDYLYATRNPSYKWARQILVDVLHSRMSHGAGQFVEMEASEMTTFSRRTTLGGSREADDAAPAAALQQDVHTVSGSPAFTPAAGAPERVPSITTPGAELLVLDKRVLLTSFRDSARRVIFLDWGGTLIEREGAGTYVKHEFIGRTRRRRLPAGVVQALTRLAADPGTALWVVTGLSPDVMESSHLMDIPSLNIAAENGAMVSFAHVGQAGQRVWQRHDGDDSGSPKLSASGGEWSSIKAVALALMREYQWRVNGAVIRTSPTTAVFDFRNADPEWAQAQARHLVGELARRLISPLVRVHMRKGRVEVVLRGATRRQLVQLGLQRHAGADFVMAIGDDASDEEMFQELMQQYAGGAGAPGSALRSVFTITVGRKRTGARHFLPDVAHVQLLLGGMAELTQSMSASNSGSSSLDAE